MCGPCMGHLSTRVQLITGGQWGEIQPVLCRTRHRSGACVHPQRLPPPYGIELAPNIYLLVPWFVPSPPPQSPRKHLKHTPPTPLTREYTPFSWHDLRGLELGPVFGGPLLCFANPSRGKQLPLCVLWFPLLQPLLLQPPTSPM